TGNPFTTGSAQQLRIWSYGLRNPYTFCFKPGTGKIFINDVGENSWEEINEATTSGLNYGWSTAEGNSTNGAFTNPVYLYAHGTGTNLGCGVTGGAFFNPSSTHYPSTYLGKYFYVDFCGKWIDKLSYNGSIWIRSGFATNISGHPVALAVGPDGNLYYLSRDNSALYKIVYTSTNALEPLDDAYVVSGTSANNNYGALNILLARKASTTSNKDEQFYLRFSLQNAGTSVSNAKLRLYGAMNVSTPSSNIDVRYTGNLNWDESTLTYNNKPVLQSTIYATKTISGITPQYYEWDLTSLIQARKNAGATEVSLVLKGKAKVANFAKFNSKEAASNKPQLVITSSSDLAANENDNQKTASAFSDNEFSESEISIFPNPASDQFTIQSNIEKENSTLQIFDMNGSECMREFIKPGENILSTKFLSNGIYILAVETREGIIRKKLQIIR
ncbi:MAG: DNRLRE domain-containing protein, partial [Bacteroidota bacterium]